jgi:O-antigen ligase
MSATALYPSVGARRDVALRLASVAGALGAGALATAVALVAAQAPARTSLLLVGGVVLMAATTVVGNVDRLLLAVVLLDLPLQLDVNFGYNNSAADLGAFGGLNISITTVALVAVFGGQLLRWLLGRSEPGGLGVSSWPFALYVATVCASVLVASDKALALYWALLLVQTLLVFVYLARVVRTHDDLLFAASFLVAGLLAESLVMCWQWFGHAPTVALPNVAPGQALPSVLFDERMTGTFGSPNAAGSFLAMFLPLAATMAVMPVRRALRALAVAAFGFGTFALVVTFSRGAWIAFTIAFAFLVVMAVRRGLVKANLVLGLGAAGLISMVALRTMVWERVFGADAGSTQSRFPLFDIAWRLISEHPVTGVGANNFAVALRDFFTPEFGQTWLYIVHNDYVLVLAEAGVVALAAYLVFLGSIFVRAAPALRARDAVASPIAVALVAGVIGRLLHMSFDVFNGRAQVEGLVVAAALVAVAGRLAEQGVLHPAGGRRP